MTHRFRAFSLIELLVVVVIIAVLISLVLPAMGLARKSGRATACRSNLRQTGVALTTYANDFRDIIATFSWREGVEYDAAFGSASSPMQASADQATSILNRRSNVVFGRATDWVPQVLYSHLVVNDYLTQQLPERSVACPEDRTRLQWQAASDSFAFPFQGRLASAPADERKRMPFSSSYQLSPAAFAADHGSDSAATVDQGPTHDSYRIASIPASGRSMSEVSFPAQKVCVFDRFDRHGKRFTYYAYPQASQPLLFFDASVNERRTRDANQGFKPNAPSDPSPTRFYYQPDISFEAPTPSGNPRDVVYGYYQWTRHGLHGIDFGSDGSTPLAQP